MGKSPLTWGQKPQYTLKYREIFLAVADLISIV